MGNDQSGSRKTEIIQNVDAAPVTGMLPEFNRNNTKDAPVLIVSTIVKGRSGYNVDGTAPMNWKTAGDATTAACRI